MNRGDNNFHINSLGEAKHAKHQGGDGGNGQTDRGFVGDELEPLTHAHVDAAASGMEEGAVGHVVEHGGTGVDHGGPARLLMPSSIRVELNTLEATTVPAVVEAVASDIRAPEMGASR